MRVCVRVCEHILTFLMTTTVRPSVAMRLLLVLLLCTERERENRQQPQKKRRKTGNKGRDVQHSTGQGSVVVCLFVHSLQLQQQQLNQVDKITAQNSTEQFSGSGATMRIEQSRRHVGDADCQQRTRAGLRLTFFELDSIVYSYM